MPRANQPPHVNVFGHGEAVRMMFNATTELAHPAGAESRDSHLDEYLPAFDDGPISLDRNHARRPDHGAGLDIELPAVKITLHNVAFDEAFRQRARAVRAVIVGHEELAFEVEDGERQIVPLDLQHSSNVDVRSVA
jgi:hypothetical protein